jgi:hypothetical protein
MEQIWEICARLDIFLLGDGIFRGCNKVLPLMDRQNQTSDAQAGDRDTDTNDSILLA